MPLSSLKHLTLTLAILIPHITAQACYYPDHSTTSVDTPCNTTAKFSSCCGAGALCLASGLCYVAGVVSRGSCTDKSWADASCASICQDAMNPDGGTALTSCGTSTGHKYACGFNAACTDDNSFSVANMTDLILRPAQVSSAAAALGSTLADPSSNASSPSSSPESSPSSSVSPASAEDPAGFSTAAMTGVALGVGLPLLIALAAALVLLRNEKKKNAALAGPGAASRGMGPAREVYGWYAQGRSPEAEETSYPKVITPQEGPGAVARSGPVPMELEANLPAASEVEGRGTGGSWK